MSSNLKISRKKTFEIELFCLNLIGGLIDAVTEQMIINMIFKINIFRK